MQKKSSITSKAKADKIKLLPDGVQGAGVASYMENSKCNFVLKMSNYTLRIIAPELNIYYARNSQPKRVFCMYQKIKQHLKSIAPPDVSRDDLIYYAHSIKQSYGCDSVTNIDIASAYVSILHNDGFLNDELYARVCKMKKPERLACIGMLAARKDVFTFIDGEIISTGEDISPTASFFYHAVNRTTEIMQGLRAIIGRRHLFTWVDGIYFKPDDYITIDCCHYLNSKKLNYSVEALKDFNAEVAEGIILITFKKENKRKIFNIPLTDQKTSNAFAKSFFNIKSKLS